MNVDAAKYMLQITPDIRDEMLMISNTVSEDLNSRIAGAPYTMLVSTPRTLGEQETADKRFFKMWEDALQEPKFVTRPFFDIELHTTVLGYGKQRAKVVGSMRKRKHRRTDALHPIVIKKQVFEKCYPVAVGEMTDNVDNTISVEITFNKELYINSPISTSLKN